MSSKPIDYATRQVQVVVPEVVPEQKPRYDYFVIKTNDSIAFKNVFESIHTMVDEVTIKVDQDGLTMRSMDPAHVGLVDISMPNSMFDAYEVLTESSIKFGLRVDTMVSALKNLDKKDMVELRLEENGTLTVRSEGQKVSLKLIEASGSDCPLPKLVFNTKMVLNKKVIQKLVNIHKDFEYLTFESEKNKLTIRSKGDSGEFELVLDVTGYGWETGLEDLNVKENSKATFTLAYLKPWFKIIKKNSDTLELEYSTKMPCKITQRIANVGRIIYFLAPRVGD